MKEEIKVKVVVCLKQVPDTESFIKISPDQKKIDETGLTFIVNPFDEFALEEAIKMKEAGLAQSVSAVSMGPERAKEALRTAIALGIEDVRLYKTTETMDGLATAKILAEKIKTMNADLILMGKEAIDDGNMQVGPMLGELLDIPCITLVIKLQVQGNKVIAEREGENGPEVFETSTPCIITCQKGLNELRYPSIRGKMTAKSKVIPEEAVTCESGAVTISSISYPKARSGGRIVGEGAAAVPKLVQALHDEAKVI
jgi:electron transfer flavoprotein beta subunit